MLKTLRVYSYFPFLRNYQQPSKTFKTLSVFSYFVILVVYSSSKNHNKKTKILRVYSYFPVLTNWWKPYFWGLPSSSKNIKKIKHPYSIQIFTIFSRLSKTIKNHQKPSKTIKNHQKPSKTLRVYIYSGLFRGI